MSTENHWKWYVPIFADVYTNGIALGCCKSMSVLRKTFQFILHLIYPTPFKIDLYSNGLLNCFEAQRTALLENEYSWVRFDELIL